MRQEYECAICGKAIFRYPSQVNGKSAIYCSRKCQASARPKVKHPHLSEYNRLHNAERMTPDIREKIRAARLGKPLSEETRDKIRKSKIGTHWSAETREKILRSKGLQPRNGICGYRKIRGQLEHRIIAEEMLGRKLRRGEVVHHIDGNKINNTPENLMVFPSQAEHARWHKLHDKGGDAN